MLMTLYYSQWPHILSSFDEVAHPIGLKTKIQNLGHGTTTGSRCRVHFASHILVVMSNRLSVPLKSNKFGQ